ncbi:glycosyl hydrolase family 2 [Pseudoduganella lurida]|uniref:Glycosyl hydrolase family 2 n=1 Tax=Pseudoduganella lurida TaxID=1036180 RepID=A0A562RKS4_9BURK|nr:sugar-binding domain-containing protein [Pseudoduganella lurida]TWI69523.1 glycosyl hydrolase family 2 [Pseudoduganella lurida]
MIPSPLTPLARAALLACATGMLVALPAHAERTVYNFNPGWRLAVADTPQAAQAAFDDAKWQRVTLPRAWNEDDAFRKDIVDHSTGIAWYRKHFTLPKGAAGGKVFIEFEGARQAAEVFVNGQRIGLHENGINAFGFDITAALAEGSNVIAVRTDNRWDYREAATGQRYQWADKNFNANYGGLPKNVRLHVTDRLYQTLPLYSTLGTTGVYVYARDFDIGGCRATVAAESEVKNEYPQARTFTYEVRIRDRDGRQVARYAAAPQTIAAGATATVRASAPVKGLHFWSWGYGYLYDVETTLKVDGKAVDRVVTRTGFRKTGFGAGMVKLNDRVLQMKGYAQRTSNEWPAIGLSVPAWLSDYSNGLAVQSNANLIRWMHIAPWKQDVESLDRVGLMQAMPAGDAEADVTGRRWEQRVEAMRDAIVYHRNNPSIVFYESGNKGVSAAHMAEMKALRDRFDPHGGRAAGSREMLSSELQGVAEYGGEMLYINKSARIPMWAMEYSRDEGARKFWDDFTPPFHKDGDGPLHKGESAATYNRNQDSHAIEDVKRWYDYWRERPGTGTRVSSGGVNIIWSDSNTHHRGAENYRRSGEVDAMRIPKDGFYAHQVMWDGWVDVERPRAHIVGHWNYPAGTVKPVTVISSADRVELYLNGRRLADGAQSERFLFTFADVAWQPGELKAVGYDAAGRKVCETKLETIGAPVALRLTPTTGPGGLKADGADLALVQVEVVDAKGRRNPVALDTVRFDLQGPAEWRGGIAQGPDNFILARALPVEGGVNRVLVRSTTDAGHIVLRASAAGLAPAAIALDSRAVQVQGGLSRELTDAGLPLHLERGPTPATPSFRVSRVAVPVASAAAASNAAAAAASYDDDETTTWASNPGEGTPSITYTLAEAATLSEITLKLSGWRQRSYPLRVAVDGEEVYSGTTPKSLGYVTLPLKPRKGRMVQVELVGAADDTGGIRLTEVANQKNNDTGADRTAKGSLAIVEIEFYRAP